MITKDIEMIKTYSNYPYMTIDDFKVKLSIQTDKLIYHKLSDEIIYEYTITNIGNLAIWSNIIINDTQIGLKNIERVYIVPGDSRSFSFIYVIKETDLLHDYISNSSIAYIPITINKSINTNFTSGCIVNVSKIKYLC